MVELTDGWNVRDTLNKGGLCRSFGSWAGILVCEASLARTTDGFAL